MTETQASSDHRISVRDHWCLAHCVTLIQHKNARDVLAMNEQAGMTTMYPEPSPKPTTLPTRSVPSNHAASDASIAKIGPAKNWNSKRLHSMGTVKASNINAPRLRAEPSLAKRKM